jgi:hypothetical protein
LHHTNPPAVPQTLISPVFTLHCSSLSESMVLHPLPGNLLCSFLRLQSSTLPSVGALFSACLGALHDFCVPKYSRCTSARYTSFTAYVLNHSWHHISQSQWLKLIILIPCSCVWLVITSLSYYLKYSNLWLFEFSFSPD